MEQNNELVQLPRVFYKNVKVVYNPRTDYGTDDFSDIKESIRQKGVFDPISIRKNMNNELELVFGHRRLSCVTQIINEESVKGTVDAIAIIKKIEYIPYNLENKTDQEIDEIKLEENIHHKAFNAVEEAISFKRYIDTYKVSSEVLSKKISKPLIYVEKRLALLNLSDNMQKAVISKKIQVGHGLILTDIKDDKKRQEMFDSIVKENLSVQDAIDLIEQNSDVCDLNSAVFSLDTCQGCKNNFGSQSMLVSEGVTLKNTCSNKSCFLKKNREFLTKKEEELKKQGFNIIKDEDIKNFIVIDSEKQKKLGDKYNNQCMECKDFCVNVFQNKSLMGIRGVCKNSECFSPKKKKAKENPKVAALKVEVNDEDKAKTKQEQARLAKIGQKKRVCEYKKEVLQKISAEKTVCNTHQAKTLILYALAKSTDEVSDALAKELGYTKASDLQGLEIKKILNLSIDEIDRLINVFTKLWTKDLSDDSLKHYSDAVSVNIDTDYTIDKTFLEINLKDQLKEIAFEIGLDKHYFEMHEKKLPDKKEDLVKAFLETGFNLNITPQIMKIA